jgi:hypothetical protein
MPINRLRNSGGSFTAALAKALRASDARSVRLKDDPFIRAVLRLASQPIKMETRRLRIDQNALSGQLLAEGARSRYLAETVAHRLAVGADAHVSVPCIDRLKMSKAHWQQFVRYYDRSIWSRALALLDSSTDYSLLVPIGQTGEPPFDAAEPGTVTEWDEVVRTRDYAKILQSLNALATRGASNGVPNG